MERLHTQQGIAIGPILFVIAVLAVLGAAIAAGTGFIMNTSTDSAKAMAEVIVQTCDDYTRGLQMVTMQNGCDPTMLDWTPTGGGYPTGATVWDGGDRTVNNGTNQAGNGQCAVFDPRGGGMIFKPFPSGALMSPAKGAYTSALDGGVNEDAFAGFPILFGTTCINGVGTCPLGSSAANGTIIMFVPYLNYATCQQINKILTLSWDPKSTFITASSDYNYNVWLPNTNNGNVRNAGSYVVGGGPSGHSGVSEACAYDYNSNGKNSAYVFMCPLMIR